MAMKKAKAPISVPVTTEELREWFRIRMEESDRILRRQRELMAEIREMQEAIGFTDTRF